MCFWSRTIVSLIAAALVACGETTPPTATGLPMAAVEVEQPDVADGGRNQAPVIERIILRPERPRPGEQITSRVQTNDPDGDSVHITYDWRINGRRVGDGPALHTTGYAKGTVVELRVVPNDGQVEGSADFASVRIGNQPPVMLGVVLEPLGEVSVMNDVGANPKATDPDGDDLEYSYVWRINGDIADSDEAILPKEAFERGDEITLRVVADDGDDESEPLVSEPFQVVNAPPTITSKPGGFRDDGSFRYKVEASDPDGDRRLRYRLIEGPDGMAMDMLDGMIRWSPEEIQAGNHEVIVEADDMAGGKATQSFTVRVAFEDLLPASQAE